MRTDLEMIEENYVKNGQKRVRSTVRRKTYLIFWVKQVSKADLDSKREESDPNSQ